MPRKKATEQARKLYDALCERGVNVSLEVWDGHKHIDMAIDDAKLYIEVNGSPHFTDATTIERDFTRDNYSATDGYDTLRIPNCEIDGELASIVRAIEKVAIHRTSRPSQGTPSEMA